MRRLMLSRWHWSDTGTFVGGVGDWSALAPLANMQEINPQHVAQAASTDPDDSQFVMDLGAARWIDALYFAGLRCSQVAMLAITIATDSGFTDIVYYSGTISAWPQDKLSGGPSPWGEVSPGGRYEADEHDALGWNRCVVLPAPVVGRYVRIEIDDNLADDAPSLGRFIVAQMAELPINMQFGWGLTILDSGTLTRAAYGAAYPVERNKVRRLHMGLSFQPDGSDGSDDDVFARQFGLALVWGKTQPLLAIPEPDNTTRLEKTAVYGFISQDVDFTNPFFGRWAYPLTIDQLP